MRSPNLTQSSVPFEQEASSFVGNGGSWYTFNARLLPEYPSLDLDGPAYSYSDIGTKYASEIIIQQSKIRIRLFTNEPDFPTAKNNITDQVQFLIDSFGLFEGIWFTLNMQSANLPDGGFITFTTKYLNLSSPKEAEDLTFHEVCKFGEEALIIATSDFRNAMQSAIDSGLYCYRAVESIMQTFKSVPNEKEKYVWPKMNAALQIDESFVLTKIKPFADPRRHGSGNFSISGEQRDECLSATRQIIFRFCHYLKSGKKVLDPNIFSLLSA